MTYRLGLYEKSLPPFLSWTRKLSAAKEAGFDWLEISVDETDEKLARLRWSAEQITEFKRAAEDTDCPVLTMCLSGHRRYPLGSRLAEKRAMALDIMYRAADFSAAVGIRIIQLAGYDVYYEDSSDETREWFAKNLSQCVEIAAERGVLLGFETMETPFMDTVRKAMRHVSANNSPYLGIYPDVGNLTNASLLYGTRVSEDLRTGDGHILAAHLKETLPGVYRDLTFGDGHTDYVSAVESLYGMGVRMFTGEFWYQEGQDWQRTTSLAGAFLRRQVECGITQCEGGM